jgi:hypothetical protein
MKRLEDLSPMPLVLHWHENRRVYFAARKMGGRLHLRLHRLFERSPTPVCEALIRLALKKDKAAALIVRQMAYLYFSKNQMAPVPLVSQGAIYDLQEMAKNIRERYFPTLTDVSIGWGRKTAASRFRSITFGTYNERSNQVRINPLLDHPEVPSYFVEFIVFHEMLHAVCPAHFDSAGRRCVHTTEFRLRERQFPDFNRAKTWEKGSLEFFKRKSYGRA